MLSLGIIGLPNAGKSSLFKALTRVAVPIANYPFTTIEPHHGIVAVPDEKLERLCRLTPENKCIPTAIEFVDIAGLVEGAHKGEGLGNQFLSHIREVDALVEVVRAFEEKTVPHPMNTVEPERDVRVIDRELVQADLKVLENAFEKYRGAARTGDEEAAEKFEILERAIKSLESDTPIRELEFADEEKATLKEYNLLTAKPILVFLNVNENIKYRDIEISEHKAMAAPVKILAEFADLEEKELEEMKQGLEFTEDPLQTLVRNAYELLDVITFYTVKPPETRAWTVKRGSTLPEAGAAIHTDFREKFIRAEVIHIDALLRFSSWQNAKAEGKIRTEGKEYIMQEGDVVEFKI